MNSLIKDAEKKALNSIRCCPFCASSAHVTWEGLDPLLYGVACRNCGASIPRTHATASGAISVWNRRSGLATLGGKATAGLRSPQKLEAARRNLKKAREVRQLSRIRSKAEAAYNELQQYREVERADLEGLQAEDMAWFKEREHVIMADPVLRTLYLSLRRDGDQQASFPAPADGSPTFVQQFRSMEMK